MAGGGKKTVDVWGEDGGRGRPGAGVFGTVRKSSSEFVETEEEEGGEEGRKAENGDASICGVRDGVCVCVVCVGCVYLCSVCGMYLFGMCGVCVVCICNVCTVCIWHVSRV